MERGLQIFVTCGIEPWLGLANDAQIQVENSWLESWEQW